MPKVGMQPLRRQQLIRAAFQVIESGGLEEATIASVAKAAGLSSGIVSHYFGNKDGLLEAAMRQVLRDLGEAVARHRAIGNDGSPKSQLRAIVDGNFDRTQTSPAAMRTWLAFWTASLNKPEFSRLQRINDRRLHSNLTFQFARVLPQEQARTAATGIAALIDGLWLRGTLSGGEFQTEQARTLAYAYIDQQLPNEVISVTRKKLVDRVQNTKSHR